MNMNGKSKCKLLKEIRRQIAAENDIEFVTSECKFQGNCSGTCPKCEAEVRYLGEELSKRQRAGRQVAVAGIAAAMVVASAGCMPVQTGGDPLPGPDYSNCTEPTEDLFMGIPETLPTEDPQLIQGKVQSPEDSLVDGEMVFPEETDEG